jgi:uncharacterized protein
MKVVSNTSPLLNLATIGQLNLLRDLYGQVILSPAVYHEIVVAGAGQPGAQEVEASDWLDVRPVSNQSLVTALQVDVDIGEASAMVLALELKADLLLLDERKGRLVASRLGLKMTGVLGILIEAKRHGLIAAVKPILDALIGQVSFRVSSQLYQEVLKMAKE